MSQLPEVLTASFPGGKEVRQAVVVGAGTMGHGIAQVLAQAGIVVELVDRDRVFVDKGIAKIKANLDAGVAKGKVTAENAAATLQRLTASTSPTTLPQCDLFVEAIPEQMAWKKELFASVDAQLPAGALLGSNTSSLSITEIATATKRPHDVIGLHFFNPVHIMKLLEIVRGKQTSQQSVDRALTLARQLHKTPIVVNDSPGFATSRLGLVIGLEAIRMLEQGVASAADIDTAMKLGYGHPMGPLQLTDVVGLDVRLAIAEAIFAETQSAAFLPPQLLRDHVAAGRLGKKSGHGFYRWQGDILDAGAP
jgi:3-hydroxybutyryl-CoA dehydrogenase